VKGILRLAKAATQYAGREAEYYFEVGEELLFLATGSEESSGVTLGPLERLQLLDASHEALEQACLLNPIVGEYHFRLGGSYDAVGLDRPAEREFTRAVALCASDRQMHTDIARFYERIGRPEEAQKHLLAAERLLGGK
jgi:tetratricopeptide (TPR) repeat protein